MRRTVDARSLSCRPVPGLALCALLFAGACAESAPGSPSGSGTTSTVKPKGTFAITSASVAGTVEIFNGGPYRRWYTSSVRVAESTNVGANFDSWTWTVYDKDMNKRTYSGGGCGVITPGSYNTCEGSWPIGYNDFAQGRLYNFTVTLRDFNGYEHTLTAAGTIQW